MSSKVPPPRWESNFVYVRSIPAAFNYIEVHQHLRPRSRFLSRSEEITLLAEERRGGKLRRERRGEERGGNWGKGGNWREGENWGEGMAHDPTLWGRTKIIPGFTRGMFLWQRTRSESGDAAERRSGHWEWRALVGIFAVIVLINAPWSTTNKQHESCCWCVINKAGAETDESDLIPDHIPKANLNGTDRKFQKKQRGFMTRGMIFFGIPSEQVPWLDFERICVKRTLGTEESRDEDPEREILDLRNCCLKIRASSDPGLLCLPTGGGA